MVGEKGSIATGSRPEGQRLYPEKLWNHFLDNPASRPKQTIRRPKGGHLQEWTDAIKGDGPLPGSNFDYAADLTEMTLLGVMAQRFNTRIEFDAEKGVITNKPELNRFIKEPVRKGWEYGNEI
jgi:hypothetical protein